MQQFIDNWSATLLAPATDTAASLSIEPAKAALLVGLGGEAFYRLTLVEVDEGGAEVDWDVVQVTAVAGGVLTVIRTDTARSWAAGTLIEARLTAAGMAELRDAGGFELGDAAPLALGSASAGASALASREDHQHPAPTPGDIGAATAAQGDLADTAVQPAALTAALAGKVDKEAGKGLSSNDFTSAEKTKLAGLEGSHFKGLHASLAALLAAHPTGAAGDYADVDGGAGVDVVRYLWDVTDAEWVAQAASGGSMTAAEVKTAYESNPDTNAFTDAEKTKLAGVAAGATANADTDSLAEGGTNKYFTEPRVRNTLLTGLSLLAGGAITAADSVLSALGRLQKQISDAITAIGGKQDTLVSGTSLKTVNGNSLLGAGDLSISAGAALAQVVEYTGTAKTLSLTDINTIIDCTSSSAVAITIPPQSAVTWTSDAEIHVRMSGTGVVSIAVGAGVTIPPLAAPIALSGQGAMVTLKRRSSDVWALVGSVVGGPDVVGPASSVDNEIARFDGATGKKLKAGIKHQTSKADATAGALMIVGAGGLLENATPATTDLDALTHTQFIREAGATGSPGSGTQTMGLHITGPNSDVAIQLLGRQSADKLWWRRKNAAWAVWMEIFHSAAACLLTVDTASLGFGTGSGGSVTQATSKTTAVTLNKPSGRITMNNAALAAGASVLFNVLNSTVSSTDCVVCNVGGSFSNYRVETANVGAGAFNIRVTNVSAGSLSEAVIINFVIIKGAIA